ncbi:MAG: DoxX family protein [Rubricoccaceae bacterium]
MNTALWIAQGLLAVAFLGAGLLKLVKSKDELAPRMPYVEDFSAHAIKAIAGIEVIGAVGLILPWLLGIAPVLTVWAAIGCALTMIGAAIVHIRRGEMSDLPVNLALLGLALFIAWGRWGA